MKNLILIKLGGSIITDKNKAFFPNRNRIRSLAKEIKYFLEKYTDLILLAHGSGSFGHVVAKKYGTQEGIIRKDSIKGLSLVADAAVKINRIVIEEFLKVGLPAVSFSPSSFIQSKDLKLDNVFVEPIVNALSIGLIPVVYGDVIMDKKRGFCIFSGEKTLGILANALKKKFKIRKIIYASDTDGVYDSEGKIVPLINNKIFKKLKGVVGGSKSADVTGGMFHKVKEGLKISRKEKIKIILINGNKKDYLKRELQDKKVMKTIISHDKL